MDELLNLCRHKIILSRLRAKNGLDSKIPPLVDKSGILDFSSIDAKAMELVEHIAVSHSWTIQKFSIDMSPFTIGMDGVSLECIEPSGKHSDDEGYLAATFIEYNAIEEPYCTNILFLLEQMLYNNGGLIDYEGQEVTILHTSMPMSNVNHCISNFEQFLQNSDINSCDTLQSGYDVVKDGDTATVYVYLLKNCFMLQSMDVVSSYSYGFDWMYLEDCFNLR